jgi:alpha/beta superfamily hydrolase
VYPKGNLLIPAPHGQLEAIYKAEPEAAERAALVLHPHPQHGGTMHNKVVFRAARALEKAGFATLRLNFRGVGQSTGAYDAGRGEAADARVALDHLLGEQPQAREVIVAGFSFGAAIGLRVGCADERVHRLISIGTPARFYDLSLLGACHKPKLFLHGDADDIAPLAPLEQLLGTLPAANDYRLVRLAGAGHFFDDQLPELMQAILEFVGE